MTLRLTIGIDPGLTGAIATLIDGEPGPILDMPTLQVGKWREVDGEMLCANIRDLRGKHPGAYVSACLEKVGARPGDGGTSAFRFGEGYGKVKCVLEVLAIPYSLAIPAVWKRQFGLIGQDKDAARVLALKRFPCRAGYLARKKDVGRADALWLALWHEQQDMRGNVAA